jgi:EAL domain-containing protein (putative c-di-GMP-specific phosphodiesterase class I)/GGDEF domain-containing protein
MIFPLGKPIRRRGGGFVIDLQSGGLPRRALFILIVVSLLLLCWWVVFLSGGSALPHVHLVYVPIIISAFVFGPPGGVAAGVAGAILMGPLMPLDVATGQEQSFVNWSLRGAYFTGFGILVGGFRSALNARNEKIVEALNYDSETKLYRTSAFLHNISDCFVNRPENQRDAMIQFAVKNYDELIVAFGLEAYEAAIQSASARLSSAVPEASVLGRSGRDRLNVFLPDCNRSDAMQITAQILEILENSEDATGVALVLSLEAGVAISPDDASESEELLRAAAAAIADGALTSAQVHSFDRRTNDLRKENLELLAELRRALMNEGLAFYAQPKARCRDLSFCGAELLVRWNHPERGFIPPDQFIPLAERSHLRGAITTHALRSAFAYIGSLNIEDQSADSRISVNLSGEDVTDERFPERLSGLFRSNPNFLRRLELEVTETALVRDWAVAVPVLEALREMGITIAIDDFGTGYSSLAYLRDIPADTIKLDRAFIKDVVVSSQNQCIVRHAIDMAMEFGLTSVAEGVEDEATMHWLCDNDCDMFQGYWFARPMPQADMLSWLDTKSSR